VIRTIVLDAGPLGLVTNPKYSPQSLACAQWLETLVASGAQVIVPEISDYEVRRELLRAQKRNGIPSKDWLFGAYSAELDEDCPSGSDDFQAFEGVGTDSYGRSRGAASGYYNSHGSYWWQHDFFVHSGAIVDASSREAGSWLTGAWYTAANGGFDSRWVQLFDDRPGIE
jgi:hypothetical protein